MVPPECCGLTLAVDLDTLTVFGQAGWPQFSRQSDRSCQIGFQCSDRYQPSPRFTRPSEWRSSRTILAVLSSGQRLRLEAAAQSPSGHAFRVELAHWHGRRELRPWIQDVHTLADNRGNARVPTPSQAAPLRGRPQRSGRLPGYRAWLSSRRPVFSSAAPAVSESFDGTAKAWARAAGPA